MEENFVRLFFRSESIVAQKKSVREMKKKGYELFDIDELGGGKILLCFKLKGKDDKIKSEVSASAA